jgi:large subunit ribosomal protein L9
VITAGGFSISRTQVPVDKAIKTIGMHEINVVLHPEVRIHVTINVARTEDEAERQARGEDVLAEIAEEQPQAAAPSAEGMFEEGAGPKPEASEAE